MRFLLPVTWLFVALEFSCYGQDVAQKRLELPLENNDEFFDVIPANDNGIFLYREVQNTETKMERKWEVYLIDTALDVVWQNNYYVHLRYVNIGYEYYGDYLYLLFQQNIESPKADLFILRVNLHDQRSETFEIKRDFPLELTEFEVVENTMIFGGYANGRPAVICYEFGNSQAVILPGFYNDRSQLLQIEVEDDDSVFNVLTSFRTDDGGRSLSIKSFDAQGQTKQNVNLRPSGERSLLYGRTVHLNEDIYLIIGTYTRRRSTLSRGIFLASISSNGEHVINYYNYADLKNFFSYMKAKREKRIQERIQRRKIKGKKNKFNYRLLVHDVIEQDGEYIMVGEAFYPKYSNSGFYLTPGSRYYNQYGTFFEGYKYTHAVVVGFDNRGRLTWDNSFEIGDVVSYNLEQYVHVSVLDDKAVLLYLYEDEIRTKIIDGTEVLEGKAFNNLALKFEDDVINEGNERYGGLKSWYGEVLFAYGVQKIKNLKDEGVKLNREVFFLNKIQYE